MDPLSAKQTIATLPNKDCRKAIRVMIVDDSLTVRTIFSRMIEGAGGMEVVGSCGSGESALMRLDSEPADVVLLDLEMPGMGGMQALPKILEKTPHTQVLVVSSLTEEGAEHTLTALSMGAADTMLKPRPGGFDNDYRGQLLGKIRALGSHDGSGENGTLTAVAPPRLAKRNIARIKPPQILAVGASTGGIHALNILLHGLDPKFMLPILVTQHLPASFIPVFARQLELASARHTVIAAKGTEICRGEIVIAPGDGHLVVRRRGERLIADISTEPAVSGCLPSVDPMLTSLAEDLDGHGLAVILSGMGRDGVEGAASLVEAGGAVLAQDADSSAVWGMPGAVAKAGLTHAVAPPEKLPAEILALAGSAAWN